MIHFLHDPIIDLPGFDLSMKFQYGSEENGLLKPFRFAHRRDGIFATRQYLVYRFVKRYSHGLAFLICFAAWQGNRGVRSWC